MVHTPSQTATNRMEDTVYQRVLDARAEEFETLRKLHAAEDDFYTMPTYQTQGELRKCIQRCRARLEDRVINTSMPIY